VYTAIANQACQRLLINLQDLPGFSSGEHGDFAVAQPAMMSLRRFVTDNHSLTDSSDLHCNLVRHFDFSER
jgi:hypothetical protein